MSAASKEATVSKRATSLYVTPDQSPTAMARRRQVENTFKGMSDEFISLAGGFHTESGVVLIVAHRKRGTFEIPVPPGADLLLINEALRVTGHLTH